MYTKIYGITRISHDSQTCKELETSGLKNKYIAPDLHSESFITMFNNHKNLTRKYTYNYYEY